MRLFLAVGIGLTLLSGHASAAEATDVEDEKQKLSYSVGYQVGGDFRRQGLEIDPELVVKGVLDAQSGSEPLMTPGEMRQTLTELKQQAGDLEEQQNSIAAEQQRLTEQGEELQQLREKLDAEKQELEEALTGKEKTEAELRQRREDADRQRLEMDIAVENVER